MTTLGDVGRLAEQGKFHETADLLEAATENIPAVMAGLGKGTPTTTWLRAGTKDPHRRHVRRAEAWQAGERMPEIIEEVFERHRLHEPPWGCWTARKGAKRDDIDFWIDRRNLSKGTSKDGKRIYGLDLDEDKRYELS